MQSFFNDYESAEGKNLSNITSYSYQTDTNTKKGLNKIAQTLFINFAN